MTKDEWINRCAARYETCSGLTPDEAKAAAEKCFYAESGESGFEFSEAVEYHPEECADAEMAEFPRASDAPAADEKQQVRA